MAEAVIVIDDDEPQTSAGGTSAGSKFFCHSCQVEFNEVSAEYTCPLCAKGFIEELPAPAPPNDVEMQEDEAFFPFLTPAMNTRLTNEISSLLMSVTGNSAQDQPNFRDTENVSGGGPYEPYRAHGPGRRSRRSRNQTVHFADFDIVQEFLVNVTGRGPGGGPASGPMYFMGNPEDYVYGREGLDTIVTQLLNQMDGTGPPPLTKDKISEIPKVAVLKEQVDEKLQCSICWEDFILDETVRKLPCVHIYHEMCIVPWLELHGTCPVCRQALCPDESDDGQQQRANDVVANSLRNVAALYRTQGSNDPMITITTSRQPPGAIASTSRRPQTARRGIRRRSTNDRSADPLDHSSDRRDEDEKSIMLNIGRKNFAVTS